MSRALRIAAITAGLVATGALAGAVLGVLIMALSILGVRSLSALWSEWAILLLGAGFGAVMGAMLAPAIAWLLLRCVPLGRAVGQTFLGAALGAVLGMILSPDASIAGALIGFCGTAIWLRATTSRQASSASP